MSANADHHAQRHLPDPIASRLPALREIARRHGVRSIAVVGSAATGGFAPDRSDLDLLVDFGEYAPGLAHRAVDFHRETEALFGRRVDILSVHGIRSPYWKAVHDAGKVPVYAAA